VQRDRKEITSEDEEEEDVRAIHGSLDPQLKVRGTLRVSRRVCAILLHVRVRVLHTRVREQSVAARVHRWAERTGVLPGEMHVIVIAHVCHDLTAQRAPPPLVAVTLSLKYL